MILCTMFPYFGSKWMLSSKMPPPLGKGPIIEPFCGGAGYSLRYGAGREVWLNDVGPVGELWEYILSATAEELRGLPDDELDVGQDIRQLNIPQGAKLLVAMCQTTGRFDGSDASWKISKWGSTRLRKLHRKHKRDKGAFWGGYLVERVLRQREFMKKWKVTQLDYREVPNVEGTWVIDPPYVGQYSKKYSTEELDYVKLGSWCRSREGLVLVNENEGADWLPFQPLAASASGNYRTALRLNRPIEVLWSQGIPEEPFDL
jgi:hypothetical protein